MGIFMTVENIPVIPDNNDNPIAVFFELDVKLVF